MRSFNPNDKYDTEEAARLKAQPWQLELLELNPKYVYWGVGEDYMGEGFTHEDWAEAKSESGTLDDLNEVVNFYFFLHRGSVRCTACDGSGYNPETDALADSFYRYDNGAEGWSESLTEDELQALVKEGRADIAQRAFGHDAINRMILVRTRATRLGFYGHCETCEGHGEVFTHDECQVGLMLWKLHPRKGHSLGIQIISIKQEELPEVFAFLSTAAARNAERFSKVVALSGVGGNG